MPELIADLDITDARPSDASHSLLQKEGRVFRVTYSTCPRATLESALMRARARVQQRGLVLQPKSRALVRNSEETAGSRFTAMHLEYASIVQ